MSNFIFSTFIGLKYPQKHYWVGTNVGARQWKQVRYGPQIHDMVQPHITKWIGSVWEYKRKNPTFVRTWDCMVDLVTFSWEFWLFEDFGHHLS